ncbi:MAG TPA: ferrochelatase [Kofleriaceae bacterium]|nr:ferrochelatase [Kofleriaceae bacterium]
MATGLLLVNLGTPDEPTTGAVRRYLREFLSDPRVLDMNGVGRWFLLNLVILPFRPAKSAHAYRQIWDAKRGSPLLYHSRDLAAAVAEELGTTWHVALAMRYGNPSIKSAVQELVKADVDRIVVVPLYPQYASSSTGSTLEALAREVSSYWNVRALEIVPAFFDDDGFLDAFAEIAKPKVEELGADHVLFSFHGLPERQIAKSDEHGGCLATDRCCDAPGPRLAWCYRAQSYATARSIAARLALPDDRWSVSFQSRLGKVPWIKPYTDVVLDELAKKGVKRLAVVCPAFVADCLETLEEIGIRARAQFKDAGGDELALVPSLNAHPSWARALAAIARRYERGSASRARPALRVVD